MNEKEQRNWAEAVASGEKRFKMVEPCKNGHLGERYTNGNGACVACQKEYYARKRKATRVVIDLVDADHVGLLREYAQTLNAYARSNGK